MTLPAVLTPKTSTASPRLYAMALAVGFWLGGVVVSARIRPMMLPENPVLDHYPLSVAEAGLPDEFGPDPVALDDRLLSVIKFDSILRVAGNHVSRAARASADGVDGAPLGHVDAVVVVRDLVALDDRLLGVIKVDSIPRIAGNEVSGAAGDSADSVRGGASGYFDTVTIVRDLAARDGVVIARDADSRSAEPRNRHVSESILISGDVEAVTGDIQSAVKGDRASDRHLVASQCRELADRSEIVPP